MANRGSTELLHDIHLDHTTVRRWCHWWCRGTWVPRLLLRTQDHNGNIGKHAALHCEIKSICSPGVCVYMRLPSIHVLTTNIQISSNIHININLTLPGSSCPCSASMIFYPRWPRRLWWLERNLQSRKKKTKNLQNSVACIWYTWIIIIITTTTTTTIIIIIITSLDVELMIPAAAKALSCSLNVLADWFFAYKVESSRVPTFHLTLLSGRSSVSWTPNNGQ